MNADEQQAGSLSDDPLWYKDAVFYELHLRAYNDSDGDGIGDFRGAMEKLEYLQWLGIDCIWILPMYPSPLVDDGYDIADYRDIHPDLGTLEDFEAFVEKAHGLGMRVVTDLIMNHTSDQHPWFQASRRREAPYTDWYVWNDTDDKYNEVRIIFLDHQPSNWAWDERRQQYFWHRFYAEQPDLNFDNPEVQEEIKDVIRFWLAKGLDGFRADAIPYLYEREGSSGENLPETHDYLKGVRRMIDREFPGRILLGEANMWPEDVRPYFGDEDDPELQMSFHFPVMPRIFKALKLQEAAPIIEIMARTPDIPSEAQWVTFLRNHDELTLEMVTEEDRQWMWEQYAPEPRMRLNLGIRRRLAPLLDNDRRKIELANSILFTLPGSPIIYYGDEIGMGDNIHLPDRHGVRTPMQWESSETADFSDGDPDDFYNPIIRSAPYGPETVNVAEQRNDPNSLLSLMRHLIRVRKSSAALGRGDHRFLAVENPHILAILREADGETVLALHNLSEEWQEVTLPLDEWAGHTPRELLFDDRLAPITEAPYTLVLPAFAYRWLRL
ncbi:MAG: maltose alpha-D-glucosyltransferase [Ardenticatenales bacterium]|nr:maltose alpha-D-glucosyltransferase [Ardenticatenales bacterium]MCB9172207.1 maltose alpha-D-glucosyltransferase [Ardenticatenales bacterium]